MSLFSELKRRRVIRLLVVYIGAAWVFIEAASVLLPTFDAPAWIMRLLVMLAVLGFPVTFILSWVFDITPEGIRRTQPASRKGALTILGAAVLVAAGTVAIWLLVDPGRGAAPRNTVAVLACDNWSGDPEFEYFSDGLAEDIINRLSRLPGISVIARQSTFALKGEHRPIPEIGELLNVAHVLVCSVRQTDGGIRVNAQLVDTSTNLHIWSTVFDREIGEVFDVLDEISVRVADSVLVELLGDDRAELARHDTEDVEALRDYMQGRFLYNQLTPESLRQSAEAFERALDRDPGFALAHVGLADTLVMQMQMDQQHWDEVWPRVEYLLNRALTLDSDLGDAYAMLGLFEAIPGSDWERGRKLIHRAVELRPNSHLVLQNQAFILMFGGPREEAIAPAEAARAINPLESFMSDTVVAAWYHARDYERSLREAENVLLRFPENWTTYWMMSWNYACLDRNDQAIAAMERALQVGGPPLEIQPGLACAYALAGRMGEAEAIWRELESTRQSDYVQATDLMNREVCLGDPEATIAWLQQALDERDWAVWTITDQCEFDPIREDPRFREIVRRIGLDPDAPL